MWSREELKTRAKEVLKVSYWKAFGVSLVLAIISGNGGGGNGRSGRDFGTQDLQHFGDSLGAGMDGATIGFAILMVILGVAFMLFFLSLRIFLGFPLEVGGRKYFIRSTNLEFKMGYLGHIFKKEYYWNVIKTMFMRGLYLILWTLLLIIPGIVKGYAYRFVPYILADNPNMKWDDAIALSNNMTDGEKWDMFVLDLSFIGWYLLGLIALVIGILFVHPYYNATYAELYMKLRDDALNRGYCTRNDLCLAPISMPGEGGITLDKDWNLDE